MELIPDLDARAVSKSGMFLPVAVQRQQDAAANTFTSPRLALAPPRILWAVLVATVAMLGAVANRPIPLYSKGVAMLLTESATPNQARLWIFVTEEVSPLHAGQRAYLNPLGVTRRTKRQACCLKGVLPGVLKPADLDHHFSARESAATSTGRYLPQVPVRAAWAVLDEENPAALKAPLGSHYSVDVQVGTQPLYRIFLTESASDRR